MCGKVVGSCSRIHRSGFNLFKRRTMAFVKRVFSTRSEWRDGSSIERATLQKTIISGHCVEGTWFAILRRVGAMPSFVPRFQSSQETYGKLVWIARTLGSLSMTKRKSKMRNKSREASKTPAVVPPMPLPRMTTGVLWTGIGRALQHAVLFVDTPLNAWTGMPATSSPAWAT